MQLLILVGTFLGMIAPGFAIRRDSDDDDQGVKVAVSAHDTLAVNSSKPEDYKNNPNAVLLHQAVEEFRAWGSANCPPVDSKKSAKIDCTGITTALLMGVLIYLPAIVTGGSFDAEQVVLTATFSEKAYGEIVYTSRVPLSWVLDEAFTVQVQGNQEEMNLIVTGLHAVPPAQADAMYEHALTEAKVFDKASSCVPEVAKPVSDKANACIGAEVKAAGDYIKKNYKAILKHPGMISKILTTSYDVNKIYYMIAAKSKWPIVMYSFITAIEGSVTRFGYKPGCDSGCVWSSIVPDVEDTMHKSEKSKKMGLDSLIDAGNFLKLVKSQCKSGMNIAMMVSYGDEDAKSQMVAAKLDPASAAEVLNAFTACDYQGLTEFYKKCTGKVEGRVRWTTAADVTDLMKDRSV